MNGYERIRGFVKEHADEAELIRHETAIVDLKSGAEVFDINHAAATYIVESKEGVFAVVASAVGHLGWRPLGRARGLRQIHLASRESVRKHTGYDARVVGPLFLGDVRMFFDRRLLAHDRVYCGAGDAHHTLSIAPRLIIACNDIAGYFDGAEFLPHMPDPKELRNDMYEQMLDDYLAMERAE